jgi:hypothetical protein
MLKLILTALAAQALIVSVVAPAHAIIIINGVGDNAINRNGGGDNDIADGMDRFAIDGIELPAVR